MANKSTHTYTENGKSYAVHKLIELGKKLKPKEIPLKELMHQLNTPCWDGESNPNTPSRRNFTPLEAYRRKEEGETFRDHYNKALRADLSYPILINGRNNMVVNGVHRLLKAYILGYKKIKVVVLKNLPEEARVK